MFIWGKSVDKFAQALQSVDCRESRQPNDDANAFKGIAHLQTNILQLQPHDDIHSPPS